MCLHLFTPHKVVRSSSLCADFFIGLRELTDFFPNHKSPMKSHMFFVVHKRVYIFFRFSFAVYINGRMVWQLDPRGL
jgi:hypothetical protein